MLHSLVTLALLPFLAVWL